MPLPFFIEKRLLRLADTIIERRWHPTPSLSQLQQCKIISHRGDHGNVPLEENTMAAFDRASIAGVWGIELDLRFTADLEPVVIHDADLSRVYGQRQHIAELSCDALKHHFPAIPTLAEVVQRFGQKLHLMIEVKQQPWPNPDRQMLRLREILSDLSPSENYHMLCLHPRALKPLEGIPPHTRVVISEYWPGLRGRWIKHRQWGGLCGHYLLLRDATIHALHRNGQKVGVGYVRSRNSLFREVNRGVDWIFSNDAICLQHIVNTHLQGSE